MATIRHLLANGVTSYHVEHQIIHSNNAKIIELPDHDPVMMIINNTLDEIKRAIPDLPKLTVKLVDNLPGTSAIGFDHVIWICVKEVEFILTCFSGILLFRLLLHEIAHACYRIDHIPNCPLMGLGQPHRSILRKDDYINILKKHIKWQKFIDYIHADIRTRSATKL